MNPNSLNKDPFAAYRGTTGIQPVKLSAGAANPFDKYRTQTIDLKSPQGLYNMATEAGLEKEARQQIQKAGGESQEYLSGGFIMDTMDVLNTFSYGFVGLAKGKGFSEGVKNRESLSDDDALGKYGFAGKLAGFVGDIVLDPLTWVAPWKIVSKIPGVMKVGAATKNKLLGELTTIEVEGQKFFHREGGWTPLTFLSDKLIYGSAVDKTFLEGLERKVGQHESLVGYADDLLQKLNKLNPETFSKTLSKDLDGYIVSTDLKTLQRDLKPEEFDSVSSIYQMRDDLMKKLVDLGVVSKETADEHWGTYLKQSYDEYLERKGMRGKSGVGIESKARDRELTPAMREALGQVDNPAVVWGTTLLKQIDLIKKAEIQKYISDGYAMTEDMLSEYYQKGGLMENLHRVGDSSAYKLVGKRSSLTGKLASLRTTIKSIKKERRAAGKDLTDVESRLDKLDTELSRLKGMTEEQLGEAWSGVKRLMKESGIYDGPMKKAPTSIGQQELSKVVSGWLKKGSKTDRLLLETKTTKDLWKEMKYTKEGFAIQRAFQDPRLMYQWTSPEDFIDAVRYPNKSKVFQEEVDRLVDVTDAQAAAKIKKAEESARKIGALEQEKLVLSDTNLKMIQDIANKIEDDYADSLWQKSNILDELDKLKHGELAGKYVSKEIWEAVKGSFEPSKEIGETLVMTFKHAKVIWNPASHMRNAFSASIQNWWKLGMGPWRVDIYYDALKEFKTNGKYLNDMRSMGFNERSGYINELLSNYLTNKELMQKTLAAQLGSKNAVRKYGKSLDRWMMGTYAHVDNVAKVAAYKYGIKKGLSKEDAYRQAMAATFNYSEVTPFVQRMRKAIWGVPFVTFALKAAPLAVETLVKSPHRISVFGKARNDLFKAAGIEGEQEAEAMPDYMRDDMFVMRLPWKDELGRSMYFDLSYIIPFGALADGSYLKDPLQANPILNLVRELSTNETFSGNKIFNETDDISTVLADISSHTLKLGLPPSITDGLSDGYLPDGTRKPAKMGWNKFARTNTQDLGPGERSFYQETFRMLGVGALPYNVTSQESSLAYRQKENLTKLLTENGVIKTFDTGYLPKDSEYRPENQGSYGETLYDREVKPIGR